MATEAIEFVKNKINEVLEANPKINEHVESVAKTVNVEKPLVVIGVAAVPILLLLVWINGDFAIDLIGFLYPLYASIKAIESDDKEEDSLWLAYWLIFALFKVIEGVLDFVVGNTLFYFVSKAAFLVYCFHPYTKGAKNVYDLLIKPYVVPHLGLDTATKKQD